MRASMIVSMTIYNVILDKVGEWMEQDGGVSQDPPSCLELSVVQVQCRGKISLKAVNFFLGHIYKYFHHPTGSAHERTKRLHMDRSHRSLNYDFTVRCIQVELIACSRWMVYL